MSNKIGVGINQNVYLKSVSIGQQYNELAFTFDIAKDKVLSAFEALQQSDVTETNTSSEVKLFPPNVPTSEKIDTIEKKLSAIERDLNRIKGVLIHILKQYTTEDKWSRIGKELFSNIEIDANNYQEKILQQPILTSVYNNMVRIFQEEITEFLNNKDLKFRLLLVRQSKDKHFATFRTGNYIEDQPFYESMSIPAEASKVAFTKYELDNGLNDGTPTSRSEAADKKTDAGEAPKAAANIFGQQ